jgi:UDP-glucose 4-epimerase
MTRVAVLGASGFIGSAVVEALQRHGASVTAVRAPRLRSTGRSPAAIAAELQTHDVRATLTALREALRECEAVVNAAGVAHATSAWDPEMVGANALLPLVVADARPTGARLVHVSSVAVQGRGRVLDESATYAPFSPYSTSKALGEQALEQCPEVVVFRPTSVHGAGREVTRALLKVLSSPAASVAGRGDRATPQVLVQNVADAVAFVTLSTETPPRVVLQPSEHLTVRELVTVLGGREPKHVPTSVARLLVALSAWLGRWSGPVAATSRRLEMMWFGQEQSASWLEGRWSAPVGREGWRELSR